MLLMAGIAFGNYDNDDDLDTQSVIQMRPEWKGTCPTSPSVNTLTLYFAPSTLFTHLHVAVRSVQVSSDLSSVSASETT